jgi:hypothetical protein
LFNTVNSVEAVFDAYNTGAFVGTYSNHPFSIRINNSDKVYVTTNGNVGIGTTVPDQKLVVNGGVSASNVAIKFNSSLSTLNGTTYTAGRISSGFDTTSYSGAYLDLEYPTGDNIFSTGLRVKNGNVGIGTTDSKTKLQVSGQIYQDGAGTKMIFKSPDGSCSACGPDNSDAWTCAAVTCP